MNCYTVTIHIGHYEDPIHFAIHLFAESEEMAHRAAGLLVNHPDAEIWHVSSCDTHHGGKES